MKEINEVINHIASECCIMSLDRIYSEYRRKMNHALKKYIACEITKDEYIFQTAKFSSKFITKVAADVAENAEVIEFIS